MGELREAESLAERHDRRLTGSDRRRVQSGDVFSRRLKAPPHPEVELLKGDLEQLGRTLKRRRGKDVWLVGGGELIGAFLDAGQVDELIVHVIPVLIGEGIPLIAPRHREVPLQLTATRKYSDGVVRLSYTVPRRKIPGRESKSAMQGG